MWKLEDPIALVKCIHLKKKHSIISLMQSEHHENNVAKNLKRNTRQQYSVKG